MDELAKLNMFQSTPLINKRLIEYGTIKTFKDGEAILNENSYIRTIPIILNGNAKVMRTEDDGREILLYYIQAGESCIMSFMGGMHNDTSKLKAIADEDVEVLLIPMNKLDALIKEFPQWLEYILALYHQRFEELLDIINAIAFKKMDMRLLTLLQKKSKLAGQNNLNITHEQLANELGTVRVVISRLLKQMEEEKLVVLGRNKITLL